MSTIRKAGTTITPEMSVPDGTKAKATFGGAMDRPGTLSVGCKTFDLGLLIYHGAVVTENDAFLRKATVEVPVVKRDDSWTSGEYRVSNSEVLGYATLVLAEDIEDNDVLHVQTGVYICKNENHQHFYVCYQSRRGKAGFMQLGMDDGHGTQAPPTPNCDLRDGAHYGWLSGNGVNTRVFVPLGDGVSEKPFAKITARAKVYKPVESGT